MNAVKAYFNRNWTREDLMNTGEISEYAYTSLTTFAENIGVSYSLLCHVELYFWILLALDHLGSGMAVHSPFFCSKFTLALLCITIESEAEDLTIAVCSLYLGCFFLPCYQISLRNLSTVRLKRCYTLFSLLLKFDMAHEE
ncbi:hypothetical protein MTR67_004525 [Solanum verrucosum]|uniref:Uncharacterized protein n=1 Tax=Solanum verrucosum TaxID=315347 RepID=A0AAF0TF61_SOLVR|nr:hypothetical protein MTR67_004525 [Solanum verrucosum]